MDILSSAYLAPVSYYRRLYNNSVIIDGYCNYLKQSYRNRCRIATEAGVMTLSVPVEKPHAGNVPTRDMLLCDHGNWAHLHWTAITSAYNSSPFFMYYCDDIRPFFENPFKYRFLFDFNEALRETVCRLLCLECDVRYSVSYVDDVTGANDLREAIHPKRVSPEKENLLRYYQVFEQRNGFISDLSILDLLFNMGPESMFLLKKEPVEI